MSQGIYISGAEPRSGKSVVVLGIMEMLFGRMGKVGFFCPVVRDEQDPDNITNLIIRRYDLKIPYPMMCGNCCRRDPEAEMETAHQDGLPAGRRFDLQTFYRNYYLERTDRQRFPRRTQGSICKCYPDASRYRQYGHGEKTILKGRQPMIQYCYATDTEGSMGCFQK